jgi:arsenate reductase (glutaredoxin)
MKVIVVGIPTCGTVKKARKWLDAHDIEHDWLDLRKTPPAPERVAGWVASLGAKAMRNTSGGSYRALGPEKADWTDDQWTTAFQGDVMLLKRPLVEIDGEAVAVGFKDSAFEGLFGD